MTKKGKHADHQKMLVSFHSHLRKLKIADRSWFFPKLQFKSIWRFSFQGEMSKHYHFAGGSWGAPSNKPPWLRSLPLPEQCLNVSVTTQTHGGLARNELPNGAPRKGFDFATLFETDSTYTIGSSFGWLSRPLDYLVSQLPQHFRSICAHSANTCDRLRLFDTRVESETKKRWQLICIDLHNAM